MGRLDEHLRNFAELRMGDRVRTDVPEIPSSVRPPVHPVLGGHARHGRCLHEGQGHRLLRELAARHLRTAGLRDREPRGLGRIRARHLGRHRLRRTGRRHPLLQRQAAQVHRLRWPGHGRTRNLRRRHHRSLRRRLVGRLRAGDRSAGAGRNVRALRAGHLRALRLLRFQPELHLHRRPDHPGPAGAGPGVGRRRLPGHRAGAAPGDDRQLPRRARLEEHAPAPRHQARPFARRLHRRMAGVRVLTRERGGARTSRTRSRRAFLGVAAALCAAACAREDARVLHFWAMGREGEVASELLAAFERENPGLRVRVEQLPWTAAHEKLLTAYAGDATPDIAQMGNTWLPEFVALDAIVPLDERLRASAQVDLGDYDPGIVATNVLEGRQYGVPWYVDTRVLFYRRDLLSQAGFHAPPRDWDEWLRMQVAIKQRGGADRYAVLLPLNEFEQLLALWLQQGEPMLRDGGRFGNFRSPGFARTLEFYLSMFERHLAPPVTSHDVAHLRNEFARGYFTFFISGPWQIVEFKRRVPPELQASWVTAPLPGPHGPGASSAGGCSLAIFRRSPRKDAAWKLGEVLLRPPGQ